MVSDPKNARMKSPSRAFGGSFLAELIKGLTAGGMVFAGVIPGPKVPSTDMRSDWEALGEDVRTALSKYAGRRGG